MRVMSQRMVESGNLSQQGQLKEYRCCIRRRGKLEDEKRIISRLKKINIKARKAVLRDHTDQI